MPGDLTHEESVQKAVEQTIAHFGRLDVLVNSAGILAMGSIETAGLAQYDKVMNVNVRWDQNANLVSIFGVFHVCRDDPIQFFSSRYRFRFLNLIIGRYDVYNNKPFSILITNSTCSY